jgi:hypothetical protein
VQLGIKHIAACSPDARGRSERAFRTIQDRLPKDFALAEIVDDIAAANRFLREVFVPTFNRLYAVKPELVESAFVPAGDLAWRDVLCVQEERVVAPDNRYGLRDFLPARPTRAASYPVAVRQVAISFHASFRRSLAVPPLRFTRASPPSGCTGDFHRQTAGHAQHRGRFAPATPVAFGILEPMPPPARDKRYGRDGGTGAPTEQRNVDGRRVRKPLSDPEPGPSDN